MALGVGVLGMGGALDSHVPDRLWLGPQEEGRLATRTLTVLFTDLAGFSRSVEAFGITHFLQTIYAQERELVPLIDENDGILLKTEGDSMLVIFRNPAKALACSIAMQRHLKAHNDRTPAEDDILLCIGLGYGHLLKIGDADVFGEQVNAASKLGEDTAKAWEILVTDSMKEQVVDAELGFEKLDYVPPGASAAYKVLYDL